MNDETKQWVTVTRLDRVSFGKVRAEASIRIGVLEIHGLRVVAKDDNSLWVALPKEKKAENQYSPIVETSSTKLTKAITDAVIDAYGNNEPTKATAEETVKMLNLESKQRVQKMTARKKGDKQGEIMPFHNDPIFI